MSTPVYPEVQITSGALIDQHRRAPAHCVYCASPGTTLEHGLTEAVGGRLQAPILCSTHNGLVEARVDGHFNQTFAPLVTMLGVPRQRGGVGATFTAPDDDGKLVTILPQRFAKAAPLDVQRRGPDGRIAHAKGDLKLLEGLPAEAFSAGTPREVIAYVDLPVANVTIVVDAAIERAALKTAFHLYAGFVADVPIDAANEILAYIVGDKVAGDVLVRTPRHVEAIFPDDRPRHEVTFYPYGGETLVSVLLFGAYTYYCRLPMPMPSATGIRYTQFLHENFPRFAVDVAMPAELNWDDRATPGDGTDEVVQARSHRVYQIGAEQSIRARTRRAFENAERMSANFGDPWERYRAQLQIEVFTAEEIDVILEIGRSLRNEGKPIWEIPVVA
jgi:hypothetical protein